MDFYSKVSRILTKLTDRSNVGDRIRQTTAAWLPEPPGSPQTLRSPFGAPDGLPTAHSAQRSTQRSIAAYGFSRKVGIEQRLPCYRPHLQVGTRVSRLPHTRSLCRQTCRKGRPASRNGNAPPLAHCSQRATAPISTIGSGLRWMSRGAQSNVNWITQQIGLEMCSQPFPAKSKHLRARHENAPELGVRLVMVIGEVSLPSVFERRPSLVLI